MWVGESVSRLYYLANTTLDIWDIIYVAPDSIVRDKTRDIAHQIAKLTQKLHEENRRYVLIGPGMMDNKLWICGHGNDGDGSRG